MAKCRSCGAEIIWIRTASGKSMPCDAAGISYSEVLHPCVDGNEVLTLVTKAGTIVRTEFDPGGDKIGYISHFATCPNANMHRKTRQ